MAYTKKEVRKRPIPPHHQGNLPIPLKKLLGKKKKTQHFLLLSILFLKPKQNLAPDAPPQFRQPPHTNFSSPPIPSSGQHPPQHQNTQNNPTHVHVGASFQLLGTFIPQQTFKPEKGHFFEFSESQANSGNQETANLWLS